MLRKYFKYGYKTRKMPLIPIQNNDMKSFDKVTHTFVNSFVRSFKPRSKGGIFENHANQIIRSCIKDKMDKVRAAKQF